VAASLIRELVDLHRRQLFGVIEVRGVGRMQKLYADSRVDLEDKLRRLARAGKGQTFQAQHLRLVLAQVADAIRGLETGLVDHMQATGRVAGNLAPRHLTNMVGTLEGRYGRMTPVVQAAQAAVVRNVYPGIAPTLLDRYRSSARRYGPQALGSIREGLARSIVQGEGVDEAVDRVVGSTGLFEKQRWRAERIVRTEMSWTYGVSNQRSMEELRPAVPKMQKRLVATFDDRTGKDSEALNGQTVPVDQPFVWVVKNDHGVPTGKVVRYMQPPNRPNDRECVIPWLPAWGTAGLAEPGPVQPSTAGLPA
jgi:hypothetical protein